MDIVELEVRLDAINHEGPYPFLNERQYAYRQAREVKFCEALAVDESRAFDTIELQRLLEELCNQASLTVQERQCFMMSETHEITEIAVIVGIGPKTVYRRIASATQKLVGVVNSVSQDGI